MSRLPRRPWVVIHPALQGEAERVAAAATASELRLRQAFQRTSAVAYGAWMAFDGLLFVAGGKERLQSPIFVRAAEVIPEWPWPYAVWISMSGLLLVYSGLLAKPLLGGLAYLSISAWQFAYMLLLWRAIAVPLPPPARLVAWPPIADHGALSAVACLAGILLIRVWWRAGRPARIDHAG